MVIAGLIIASIPVPQLNARYSDYLAEYLRSGFGVRQIGNTYNVVSNGLEQMMTLLILIVGAYTVMHSDSTSGDAFTIGMWIAFPMYSSKVSQPANSTRFRFRAKA